MDWLGLAPIALALIAAKRRGDWTQQAMTTTALLFFVWSLGPYLRIAGWNSGFVLPQTFLRFVP
ncbi:MAG TPA: hypothetical protein VJP86_01140, partial [Vicinamibacterales bacterium]|nr:hypothetical protein [Vicinamibacterales bacterium]